jgi:hypothetical protein
MADLAARAADRWYEAAEEACLPTDAQSALRKVLRWTLSEEAETAIAYSGKVPVIAAIDGARLICARPEDPAASSSDAVVTLDSIPLDLPRRVLVSFRQEEYRWGWFMVRAWTLGEPGPTALVLETRSPSSQLQGGEFGGRALLEKAATRLGWSFPEPA